MQPKQQLLILGILGPLTVAGNTWNWAIVSHSSRAETGQLGGERRDLARRQVERHWAEITAAARLSDLEPRLLAVSIFSERLFCYAPYFEPLSDWTVGHSFGLAQVTDHSIRGAFRALFQPDAFDRWAYGDQPELLARWRTHFAPMRGWGSQRLKWALMTNPRLNADCAALVLKLKLLHYRKVSGRDPNRPELAATLYHNPFPQKITGKPDLNGLKALALYRDRTFPRPGA